jgi:hypothetical protein
MADLAQLACCCRLEVSFGSQEIDSNSWSQATTYESFIRKLTADEHKEHPSTAAATTAFPITNSLTARISVIETAICICACKRPAATKRPRRLAHASNQSPPQKGLCACLRSETFFKLPFTLSNEGVPHISRMIYRIDGVLLVAEFLCSLWNRDQNTFESSFFWSTVSVCRRLGLLPQGISAGAVALI